MNRFIKLDPWRIIEESFDPSRNRISESLFSLGNGMMGQRANFEEQYSGDTLQGNYIAGVYYPDKTKVGWWKIGYPEYFTKVLNAPKWIGLDIYVNNKPLDMALCKVLDFKRVLDMKQGLLKRSFLVELNGGERIEVNTRRFLSIANTELGAIEYSIKSLNVNGQLTVSAYLDADVRNEDANYNEKFWDNITKVINGYEGYLISKTKRTDFYVSMGMKFEVFRNGSKLNLPVQSLEQKEYVAGQCLLDFIKDDQIVIYKYAAVLSSLHYEKENLFNETVCSLNAAVKKGFGTMLKEHKQAWSEKWKNNDIVIEGDVAAQQGIRFNIFQLNQTYTGEDERLNIGPKGFTGEKYGGSTYWDTEAFCLPFYLCTADTKVARNLLLYRYKHLEKAIKNAAKLGFTDGAALYPMVTINGEECHNEWEITFEEIHRNGAIAYAIHNYIRHSGDHQYLADYGLEVLIGIARFWRQRVNYSKRKDKYVILGVTGPNEYENNVNNNWYTNTIAAWTLRYTMEVINFVKSNYLPEYNMLKEKLKFDEDAETSSWQHIGNNLYFPADNDLGIFLQQEDYLDKEQIDTSRLDASQRPLNQNWSWDRILRSNFIKQADVLQGIYFFEEWYDTQTIKRNFDFYESRTVHESSLSACVHSILASRIGQKEKAYELYLRTARFDLDDYNKEAAEGCHITSMAGTWMAIVEGFGGKRVRNGILSFCPLIPDAWKSYSFKIMFRRKLLDIRVNKQEVSISNLSQDPLEIFIYGEKCKLAPSKSIVRETRMDTSDCYLSNPS